MRHRNIRRQVNRRHRLRHNRPTPTVPIHTTPNHRRRPPRHRSSPQRRRRQIHNTTVRNRILSHTTMISRSIRIKRHTRHTTSRRHSTTITEQHNNHNSHNTRRSLNSKIRTHIRSKETTSYHQSSIGQPPQVPFPSTTPQPQNLHRTTSNRSAANSRTTVTHHHNTDSSAISAHPHRHDDSEIPSYSSTDTIVLSARSPSLT